MSRILRSFAVLRRISLATLAQRLRQPQDDSVPFYRLRHLRKSATPPASNAIPPAIPAAFHANFRVSSLAGCSSYDR
ncbi:MAG TPA: hypothetical protein VF713_20340, partial [Thermoanaerobaculia bacterium]